MYMCTQKVSQAAITIYHIASKYYMYATIFLHCFGHSFHLNLCIFYNKLFYNLITSNANSVFLHTYVKKYQNESFILTELYWYSTKHDQ